MSSTGLARITPALAVLGALIAPSGAGAATTVSYDGTNGLVLRGGAGEASQLSVTLFQQASGTGERYEVAEAPGITLTPGGGCQPAAQAGRIDCNITGPKKIEVLLFDGNDTFALGEFALSANGYGPLTVAGGDGNDTIFATAGKDPATLDGDAGDDILRGGSGADTIRGAAGNDFLDGFGGIDTLEGGAGVDTLSGGVGGQAGFASVETIPAADTLDGGPDEDFASYIGHQEPLTLSNDGVANDGRPGEGDNILASTENIAGGKGGNTIQGNDQRNKLGGSSLNAPGSGNDVIRGGGGDDVIGGAEGNDQLFGEGGNDAVYGGSGADMVDGGPGTDQLFDARQVGQAPNDNPTKADGGVDGNDTLTGGDDADNISIVGQDASDTANGGAGNDVIKVQQVTETGPVPGATAVNGGDGDDDLQAFSAASATINGDAGNDLVMGSKGVDTINGGAGNDRMDGLGGDDTINGGAGNDRVEIHPVAASVPGTTFTSAGADNRGKDNINTGAGNDFIDAVDGEDDAVNCGTNAPGRGGVVLAIESDSAQIDLADGGSTGCESVTTSNRREPGTVRIGRGPVELGPGGSVAVELTCLRRIRRGCHGRVGVAVERRPGRLGRVGPRTRYDLDRGESQAVRLRLRAGDRRALARDDELRLQIVARERGLHGPRTAVRTVAVDG